MKHLKTLFALAFFGLTALAPLAAHSQTQPAPKMEPRKVESQNETRLLSEQEMQSITGAGKACNVQTGCQRPCREVVGGVAEVVPETNYYICGAGATNLPTTCVDNVTSYQCGHWVRYAGPCNSRGTRFVAGFECSTGCSGTLCPPGKQGYVSGE